MRTRSPPSCAALSSRSAAASSSGFEMSAWMRLSKSSSLMVTRFDATGPRSRPSNCSSATLASRGRPAGSFAKSESTNRSRSFAIQPRGAVSLGGFGSVMRCATAASTADSALKTGAPVSTSKSTDPNAYMSARGCATLPRICSGAVVFGEPRACRYCECPLMKRVRSRNLSVPASTRRTRWFCDARDTMMFSSFKSPCAMPRSCRAASATSTLRKSPRASWMCIGPSRLIRSASVSPSMSS